MITVHWIDQSSDEWLRMRRDLYTGSNADKLLAYATRIKLVNGVARGYALNEITGFQGNFHTRRGHMLEDEAIELYVEITGHEVIRPGFVTNSKWPGCGFSPDAFCVTCDVPLEVKAFDDDKHLKLINAKDMLDIPPKITGQIYFGQFIWEKKGGKLLPYNPRFAKKEIDGVPNPKYDPIKAFKIIPIKYNRNIMSNFKKVIEGAHYATTAG